MLFCYRSRLCTEIILEYNLIGLVGFKFFILCWQDWCGGQSVWDPFPTTPTALPFNQSYFCHLFSQSIFHLFHISLFAILHYCKVHLISAETACQIIFLTQQWTWNLVLDLKDCIPPFSMFCHLQISASLSFQKLVLEFVFLS